MIKSILGGKSKNLFDISKADVMINANIFNPIPDKWACFYKIPVTSGQTYTVSCDATANLGAGEQLQLAAQTGDKYREGTQLFVYLTTQEMVKDWVHIKATFTIPDNTTQITFSALSAKFFRNFQLELGSTATEYVPHELTSYKSIMKVSDVMQVVDKPVSSTGVSLVGTSQTKSGITCHYLEDGTGVTLTGTTSTAYAVFEFGVYKKPIIGHKYLWFYQHSNASDVINKAYIELKFIDKDGKGHWFNGTEQVYTLSEYAEKFEFHPIVKDNTTCNGFTFKPQLFDLTEMYGAGNEPKTVAEFKAKFPNDYYPYSPSCFVTSFDERMPCKTKNLFDKSNAQIINGYISDSNVFSQSSLDKTIIIPCLPNTTYTFSKISVSPLDCDRLRIGDYTAIPTIGDTINNVVNIGEPPTQNYITITTSDTAKYIVVTVGLFNYKVITTLDYILSTCQLEKGTTATDYVPYGYV